MNQPVGPSQRAAVVPQRAFRLHASWGDYWSLTKPEVNFLILISTGAAFYLGYPAQLHQFPLGLFAHTLLGTLLVASGTGALNQFIERRFDAQMRRTSRRPIPAGRLEPSAALRFGIFLSLAGSIDLAVTVNILASALALLTSVSYLFVYTPLKRRTPAVHSDRSAPGRDASSHWMGCRIRKSDPGGMDTVRLAFPLATSSLHGHRMDVPRRLCPRRLYGSPGREAKRQCHGLAKRAADNCSDANQHDPNAAQPGRPDLSRDCSGAQLQLFLLWRGTRDSSIKRGRATAAALRRSSTCRVCLS